MTMQEKVFRQEVAGETAASLCWALAACWAWPASATSAIARKTGIARLGLMVGAAMIVVWLVGWSRHYLVELAHHTPVPDIAGFVASALVLATFIMTDMRTLRVIAIFSNLAFILYGALEWLPPVVCLHTILLPVNLVRLVQTRKT
jgi:hypothetical protein